MWIQSGRFSPLSRATVLATVAAVALTAVVPTLAYAGAAPGKRVSATVASDHDITDVSARRRAYRGGGGGAAAAAAFAGIVGTGLAIAASQNRRSYYDDDYYGRRYYGGPGYYSQPYAQQPYYGSPYGGGW